MPTPYSVDLRWRAVWLNLTHGFSSQEVGEILCLSKRTVRRYLTLFHQTGDVQPATRRNGARRLLGDLEQLRLLQLVLRNPGIYLHEIQHQLQEFMALKSTYRPYVERSSSWGVRGRLFATLLYNSELLCAKFMSEVSLYDPNMLIWIDASGCDR